MCTMVYSVIESRLYMIIHDYIQIDCILQADLSRFPLDLDVQSPEVIPASAGCLRLGRVWVQAVETIWKYLYYIDDKCYIFFWCD